MSGEVAASRRSDAGSTADHAQQRGLLRIALVADGPADDHRTNSGVANGMLQALEAHPAVGQVTTVDAGFRGFWKALVALAAFKTSEAGWRIKYSQGRLALRVRSGRVRRQLRKCGEVDFVLLIRGLYEPFEQPYVLFIDSTTALAQAGWPTLALSPRNSRWSVEADSAQLRGASHVFTASRHVAEHVTLDFGIPHNRVSAIGGGLNYRLSEVPAHAPSTQPTILFVGHDFRRKGGDVLVEAFRRVRAEIPDARLLLVGRGTHQAERQPGISVIGAEDDRSQLSKLYQQATVFALPARYEPYGLVLLEAMAHGVPCVGTRVGAIPEILADGRLGLLVDSGDVAELADALTTLLLDQDLQATLSERGRAQIEAHQTWDIVADRLVETMLAELS